MEVSAEKKSQPDHIKDIFSEYTVSSRVLRSFTNLSNTVIQTALSGQSKFVFEILQNADDAFLNQHQEIEVKFILHNGYFIVQHNGKGFDFNDVERICDYASQIEEVKANDLSKTGYKGLGFKSLFNLSDCIYIYSNGYSFRFDKKHWSDPQKRPWQVIPIWCEYSELPFNRVISYDYPVNIILQVNDIDLLESQIREIADQPDLLIYLHRINRLNIKSRAEDFSLNRKIEIFGSFQKVSFFKNQTLMNTWLLKTYLKTIPKTLKTLIQGASTFIYPDKIKKSENVNFAFAVNVDRVVKIINKIKGLCFRTLPTQLHLMLPYHFNSFFVLNLDRTQIHENEWNEFLINSIGHLQLLLLRELAGISNLKNHVLELLVREINHPYPSFNKAFLKGFDEVKGEIAWLPSYQETTLLKLGEVWIDDIEFFKQNFKHIRDHNIQAHLINYDVKGQHNLLSSEAKHFDFNQLLRDFQGKYYHQLTKVSYRNFISFLYEIARNYPNAWEKLKSFPFLRGKDGTMFSPMNSLLEESENPIPAFLQLNPVDNEYLPKKNTYMIKNWLVDLGARKLLKPIDVLRITVLKWLDSNSQYLYSNANYHIKAINYLSKGLYDFTTTETENLREKLLLLSESKRFNLAKTCYHPDAICVKELKNIILGDEKISSAYDLISLKKFFLHVGVHDKICLIDFLRKNILVWIENGEINSKLNLNNYIPTVNYIADHYPEVEFMLNEAEKTQLKQIPVLTCAQNFRCAEGCYFDSVISCIQGLESAVSKNELISTARISVYLHRFLEIIGVSKVVSPSKVLQKTVVKWYREGELQNNITAHNHLDILKYIEVHYHYLDSSEKEVLKHFPVLTQSKTFRVVSDCYWPPNRFNNDSEKIPGLNCIVSYDDFISSVYSKDIAEILDVLGARDLCFANVYERYCTILNTTENVKWFFDQLIRYWRYHKDFAKNNELLNYVHYKFNNSPCLLAKNGIIYSSKELYFSKFMVLCNIVGEYGLPFLDYEKLPEDLEKYLGFKGNLDLEDIQQLTKVMHEKQVFGKKDTYILFSTILEELEQKDINKIKKYSYILLSDENKLNSAKNLYYFKEENATCYLSSCYLKRIHGMTHENTLKLAEFCGVNVLPWQYEIKFGDGDKIPDFTLKEFYLKRLPFIAFQESKKFNECSEKVMKQLYNKICSIELYKCCRIYIHYNFGNPKEVRYHFDNLKLYVVNNWKKLQAKIHKHLGKKLCLSTNIEDILDMDPGDSTDVDDWLHFQENSSKFYLIQKEFEELLASANK